MNTSPQVSANIKNAGYILIILIAFGLRLYNLTYHSLWFDEAMSVYWAGQSVPRILEVGFTLIEDRLPPLYYLTLKGWTALTGFSETGVRSLSVIFGVLLVPVIGKIAAMLFNRRIGLFAALLVALNPFLIWYSQEARMYAPAVLFGALAVWAFLNVTRHRQNTAQYLSFTVLFILFAVLALYNHLYAGFLLPALGLWLIISYPRAWRLWLTFAIGGLIIVLAYTPILLAIWRFSAESDPGSPLAGLTQRSWWLLQSFTLWQAVAPTCLAVAIPVSIALFAFAAYLPAPAVYHKHHPRLLVTLLLLIPFLIANLLLFRNQLAFFGERYFIIMTPWLLLLAAVGAEHLGHYLSKALGAKRWASGVGLYLPYLLLLLATVWPISGQWNYATTKETWRQSVAYLADHAQPDHGILIHPDWVRYPFQFYFQGPGQTYAAFSTVTSETPLDDPLQGVVNNHSVVWLIQSHLDGPDPNHLVEQWFANRFPLVTELYPPGISLKGYAPGYQLDALPSSATPTDITFANGMHLLGYQAETSVAATDPLFHPPSGWVHVVLYWATDQPITSEAAPVVQLVGPEGVWGISLERSTDALKLYPPTRWNEDNAPAIIRHDIDVNLNPLTPPGNYQLMVGMQGLDAQHLLTPIEIQ